MTTLLGITAKKGSPGVVLSSDISRTQVSWQAQGDLAYREQTRSEGQKIYLNDDRTLALCMSGVFDRQYVDFAAAVLKGDISFEEAVKKGDFEALRNLNESRWDGYIPDTEVMNSLLVASRFDDVPKLYTCFPMGKVKEATWTSIGSGSKYVINFINNQGILIPDYLDLETAVRLSQRGLDVEAVRDIYTGGLDMVVVTPTDIKEYGERIKAEMDSAKGKIVDGICKAILGQQIRDAQSD